MGKIGVKRTDKNYGLTLSGKLGSRPDLEERYVRKFISEDPKDGVTSLREAILEAYRDGKCSAEDWDRVLRTQKELQAIRDELLAAGYAMDDIVKLTMDNSEEAVGEKPAPPKGKGKPK